MYQNDIGEPIEIDIAIIGAGPAGIAAAIELSKLGHAKNMLVFDRENQVAMTSRHCDHQGFGLMEFYRPMTGLDYAMTLERKAKEHSVAIKLKHSLTHINSDILTFSTIDGEIKYIAKRILFAMGARETTRSSMAISGGRSPNIITTGALQRFVHIHHRKPFSKAVIIGSEIVSFSAIMTAREAGIEVTGIIEEEDKIKSFSILSYASKHLLKTPVHTSTKLLSINTEDKEVKSITISKNNTEQTMVCDAVIFSGGFVPESSLLQKHLKDFNLLNRSTNITHNFQTKDKRYFLAGNVIRGALAAFNCYFEGKKAGIAIHKSLQKNDIPITVKIETGGAIGWCYPTLIECNRKQKYLCKIRFQKHTKGILRILLNDKEVMRQEISAVPYLSITVDWFNIPIKKSDRLEVTYEEE